MIYLDASALVKLLVEEDESEALARWLRDRTELPKVTSELSAVEVVRTCRRHHPEMVTDARRLLAGLDRIPMAGAIVEGAGTVGTPELRSLDALHLASVLSIRDALSTFVTYDGRLAAAATAERLHITAPS